MDKKMSTGEDFGLWHFAKHAIYMHAWIVGFGYT
jgi:hypothetical protein